MLATTWQNIIPVATYILGFILGTEKLKCEISSGLQLAGVVLAVGGAVLATLKPDKSGGAAKGDLTKVRIRIHGVRVCACAIFARSRMIQKKMAC